MSVDPGVGAPKGAGCASRFASPGNAASTSSFVIPQRAALQTGGGIVVVVVVVVVAGAVVGGACCGAGLRGRLLLRPAAGQDGNGGQGAQGQVFHAPILHSPAGAGRAVDFPRWPLSSDPARPLRSIGAGRDRPVRRRRRRPDLAAGAARGPRRAGRPARSPVQLLGARVELPRHGPLTRRPARHRLLGREHLPSHSAAPSPAPSTSCPRPCRARSCTRSPATSS